MDKKLLVRFGILLGLMLVIVGAAWGCTVLTEDRSDTPLLDNPDDVYATVGGVEITNQMLWDEMKNAEGYEYLIQYIEETYILGSYIDAVTMEEVEKEIEYLTYKTRDQEFIDEIKENEELDADLIAIYENTLKLAGFNPDDEESVKSSFELGIAKYNYAKEIIEASDEDFQFHISSADLESYYQATYKGDVCVVPVRFNSAQEFDDVMDKFNIVANYDGDSIRSYIGTDPIEGVSSEDFDETNTVPLSDEELFAIFIELYNYQTPWTDNINPSISEEDFCANHSDIASFNFFDMTDGVNPSDPNSQFASHIFSILSDDTEDTRSRYTTDSQTFGDAEMFIFKVSSTPEDSFETLTTEFIDEMYDTILEQNMTTTVINQILADARTEDLELFDPIMKLAREIYNEETFDNEGSKTVFATYGDDEITAQMLFDYMAEKAGTLYTLEIAKRRMILESDTFTEQYGTDRDYINSNNEKIEGFVAQLESYKAQYAQGAAGVDPTKVTFAELLKVNFGTEDDNEVIEKVLIYSSLTPFYINDNLHEFEQAADFVQDQFDNYVSLNVQHLLVYVDFDNDFAPDDYSDYIDTLEGSALTEYNALKAEFENLLDARLNADKTFDDIVTEFNNGLVDDPENEFAAVKAYGFRLKTEDLSNINNNNGEQLDEAFYNGVAALYEQYIREENQDETSMYYNQIVTSDFGIHKILGSKGTDLIKPSAAFSEEDAADPQYSEGSENVEDMVSKAQFELFAEYTFNTLTQQEQTVTLPADVLAALEAFYGPLLDALYGSTGYSLITLEQLLADDAIEFEENNAAIIELLERQLEALYFNTLPEEYIQAKDLN